MGQLIDGATGVAVPTTRRRSLKTAADIKRQMASVYWQARRGEMPTEVASRLVYILGQLLRATAETELDARLAALERQSGVS